MINVRLFFSKKGDSRFLSHLDVMRCFTRALKCSGLDIWYTQGFNTHMYLMFSCPLSLGYESERETLDIRLVNDEDINKDLCSLINKGLPEGIRVYDIAEPVMKHTEIEWSAWQLTYRCNSDAETAELKKALEGFFSQDEIIVTRKTKRGEKVENALPLIKKIEIKADGTSVVLDALLSQNVDRALNPKVLLTAFCEIYNADPDCWEPVRKDVLDSRLRSFA